MLVKTADLKQRIDILTMLHEKAESRVLHSDTFRQRNMNYALVIFAGLVAAEIKLEKELPHYIISTILTTLMVIFAVWDRRWHRTKHGWEATSKSSYENLLKLVNDNNQNIEYETYEVAEEKTAEKTSWQPIVFYFLVGASISSYWVLGK
jgi:hypothetical protein